MPSASTSYRGRFAPTPSGPLHLGSLLTALASWLQARSRNGLWLLRFDDLDTPRCPPGMADVILDQLEAHGLEWDQSPIHQQHRIEVYRHVLENMEREGMLYACACTRKALKERSIHGPDGAVYDGHCRPLSLPLAANAFRLRVGQGQVCIDDAGLGRVCRDLQAEVGDFAIARNDGIPGYQLASVVDDRDMAISEVVRGSDLLGSSLRQRHLFDRLQLVSPMFRHLPVVVGCDGLKLSKQNHAQALNTRDVSGNLLRCLRWLGQTPPAALTGTSAASVLEWARTHWNEALIPKASALPIGDHRLNLA